MTTSTQSENAHASTEATSSPDAVTALAPTEASPTGGSSASPMQTQGGNNNPYNQDNATSWLDWDRLGVNQDVYRFFRGMIAFRKEHPSLGRSRFWRDDVRWYGTGPSADMAPDSRTLAYYLCGSSQQDDDLYVMINASDSDRSFEIQEGQPGQWELAFDTGRCSPDDFCEPADRDCIRSSTYVVHARSIAGMIRLQEPSLPRK